MDAKLKPLGDRVLVRVAKAEEKVGTIIVPDAAKKKPLRGEVLAVGPGRRSEDYSNGSERRIPPDVKPGEVVLFAPYAGTEVGDGLLMLAEADLIAIEEPAANPRSGPGSCDMDPMDPRNS